MNILYNRSVNHVSMNVCNALTLQSHINYCDCWSDKSNNLAQSSSVELNQARTSHCDQMWALLIIRTKYSRAMVAKTLLSFQFGVLG